MELICADVCRDGGSLAADFRLHDGSLLSLLLEVCEAPERGEPRRFGHLHVSDNVQNTCVKSSIISKDSAREREVVTMLDDWLSSPSVLEFVDAKPLEHVRDLRRHLMQREG